MYLKEGTYHTRLFNDTRIERERERERYRERVYYNDNPSQDEDQERLSKVTCHITIKLLTHHPTASLLPCGSKRMRSCWKRVSVTVVKVLRQDGDPRIFLHAEDFLLLSELSQAQVDR